MNGESNERQGTAGGSFGSQGGGPFAKEVKRHFLESELVTADDLIEEYAEYGRMDVDGSWQSTSAMRQKLIWLLERLQEEVL